MPMYSCFKHAFGILSFLIATQLLDVNTAHAQVPSCSMTAKDTLACRPYALLSSAINANDPSVNFRRWTLRTCGGATVFTTPNGPNPNFSFIINNPGCYCLTLFSRTVSGDTCSFTQCNIVVADTPAINMTFAPTESCTPLQVFGTSQITTGTGTITSVVIQPGCGNVVSLNNNPSNPVPINFNTAPCPPGQYDITVVAINSAGCGGLKRYDNAVTIVPKPVACFTADTTTSNCATAPLPVTFTACNTANNVNSTYNWYINGVLAQSSSSSTFSNTFAINPLCYSIKLVVTHPGGCSDSLSIGDYICVRSNPNISFTSSAPSACVAAGASSTFTLTNTTPGLANLTWSMTGFPTTTGPTATYTVNSLGNYTVTASGTFGSGCGSTLTQQVFTLKQRPSVNFTADDTFACAPPLTVNYTGQGCATCTYAWSFSGSNPNSSTIQNPSIIYPQLGNFNVSLAVTDTNGCTTNLIKGQYIKIRRINPRIFLPKAKGCAPICVNLRDSTNYTALPGETKASVCWSFPGSNIPGACKDTLNRCFVNPGCYDVKLVVTTQSGCRDSIYLNDTICARVPPVCSVTASPTTTCFEEDSVVFTILCDSVSSAYFDFGDGTKTIFNSANKKGIVVPYFYQDIGNFEAIVITYRDSCVGDTFKFNIVINAPIANFKDSSSCATADTVLLVNLSKQATSSMWYYCTGDSSSLFNPNLVLPNCDTCQVRLVTFNSLTGCQHEKAITITPPCSSPSISYPSSVCLGSPITIVNTSTSKVSTAFDGSCFNGIVWVPLSVNQVILNNTFAGPRCVAIRNISANGCVDTMFANYNVCGVKAGFGYDTVCFPSPICFQNSSTDGFCNITKYEWMYSGNIVGDTIANPCHLFPSPGSYPVKLIVTNDIGCRDSITKTVIVSSPVNLNYTVDTLLCAGAVSCVSNSSSGLALTYNWSSPGANTPQSTLANPCFSYPGSGVYPVYLEIKSNNVCSINDTFNIISANPIAGGFVSADTLTCPNPPTVIGYTDTSQFNTTWFWDFGDSTSSSIQNPGHIYTTPGSYVVTLIATNPDGCADTAIIDTIKVLGPFGDFNYNPTPGICACKDDIDFTVNTVSASALTLVYGCNVGFTTINPITPLGTANSPTSFNISVPYCIADTCTPQLIFGDNTGCQVFLEAPVPIQIDSPVIALSFDNFGVCVSGVVCFEDLTSYTLPQSYTVERFWDFGDGTPVDTAENPCHFYAQPGGYLTKLYIRSNLGCFDSLITTVVVVPEFPIAGFYAQDSLVCSNAPICFQDTSYIYPLTGPDYWIWYWGDGQVDTSNTGNFCHSYSTGGYYRVTMCVYDSIGCPDCDSSVVIRVIDNPIADAGPDRFVCYGQTTQLQGAGGTIPLWLPSNLVSNDEIYDPTTLLLNDATIIFQVGDIYGCRDTDTLVLTVDSVSADFGVGASFCQGVPVCVTDNSTSLFGTLTAWEYNFGDNTIVNTGANVCHTYQTASGNFNIKQIVTNSNGCKDTTLAPITILPAPAANFSLNDTVICADQQLCVTDLSTSSAPITSWAWNFGDNQGDQTGQNPPCHLYAAPFQNTYNVSLIAANQDGCRDTAVLVAIVNELPQASFNYTISCESQPTSFTSSSLAGDGSITNCAWTFWVGSPTPVIENNCNASFQFTAGSYPVQLSVTDANGCVSSVVNTVTVDSISQLVISPGDTTICLGDAVDYIVSGVFDNIIWTPNVWISDPNSALVTVTPLGNISYIISAVNGVCTAASDTFTIRTIQPIPIEVNATPEKIVLGLTSTITAQIPGQIDSIVWTPDETLDCNNCPNPIALPTATTTYTATIYYSENGITCTNSASVTIEVLNNCDQGIVFLPNTFTPNGDGLNDVFMIRGIAATKINYFRVFDRWGKVVFSAGNGQPNDPKWGWDGNDVNGLQLNPAVFVYMYEIECINGDVVTGKGNVTLVR